MREKKKAYAVIVAVHNLNRNVTMHHSRNRPWQPRGLRITSRGQSEYTRKHEHENTHVSSNWHTRRNGGWIYHQINTSSESLYLQLITIRKSGDYDEDGHVFPDVYIYVLVPDVFGSSFLSENDSPHRSKAPIYCESRASYQSVPIIHFSRPHQSFCP